MIKDFFTKKENIFIGIVAFVSIFFAILGFLFLFLDGKTTGGPRTIPNNIYEINWKNFDSDLLDQDIEYPEYMYITEQKTRESVGVTISEFEPRETLTYFSNQEHISFYPNGIDEPFFYGKTRESDFTSSGGQEYARTEYLTQDEEVWAVMLVPKITPKSWQTWGFVWIQTKISRREDNCITEKGAIITDIICNPYNGERIVYDGTLSSRIIKIGYEVINKNTLK